MNVKRLREPSFITSAVSCLLLIWLAAFRDGALATNQFASTSKAIDVRQQLGEVQSSLERAADRLGAVEAQLDRLRRIAEEPGDPIYDATSEEIELHTAQEAEALFSSLGDAPSAEKLADAIATVDGWLASPDNQNALQKFKANRVAALRQRVKKELVALDEGALKAASGAKAAELHAKAAHLLSLYPMESSKFVLDEARNLSARHSEIGVRIEVIRRQRYNVWAMDRIEASIRATNSVATSFKTSDNPKTIAATVESLGEVDPLLLEPVVAQLFNYAVELAKSNINSEQQLELGRKLIDPAIKRKGYGDF